MPFTPPHLRLKCVGLSPIRARLPPCERRPGEQQFGRASDAQSGVGICHLGLAFGILNSFRIFLAADPNFLKQAPHFMPTSSLRMLIFCIKLLAGVVLILAGMIHTFPFFWDLWEKFLIDTPGAHYNIGAVSLFLGIANLLILLFWDAKRHLVPKKEKLR